MHDSQVVAVTSPAMQVHIHIVLLLLASLSLMCLCSAAIESRRQPVGFLYKFTVLR